MMYESDATKFIRDLMIENPELVDLQKKNRATWWDKKLDLKEQQRFKDSQVTVEGYAYFPLPESRKVDEALKPEIIPKS